MYLMTLLTSRLRYGIGFVLGVVSLLLLFGLPGSTAASVVDAPTATPTPFVTPAVGPSGYTLKEWSSVDSLDALKEAQILWSRTRSDFPSSEGYVDYRYYLNTLEQETLTRYPKAVDPIETIWRLAYYQALGYEGANIDEPSTDRFTLALETALNSNFVSLDSLKNWLAQHNFQVIVMLATNNLFGDQKPASVLQISVPEAYDKNVGYQAIFIIQGEAPDFRVSPLTDHDHWSFSSDYNYGRNDTITVSDHNGDGQPELVIQTDRLGHNACSTELAVYEWQQTKDTDQFTNIATAIPTIISTDFACDNSWSFEVSSNSEPPIILQKERVPAYAYDCPDYVTTTRFKWIGTRYQRFDQNIEPFKPVQDLICKADWADRAGTGNTQALSLLEDALADKAAINKAWGPAAHDYLQFKLGTWYAFQGRIDLAKSTLEVIRDHPDQSTYTLPSNLAKAFLENYQDNANAFLACKSANGVFNRELDRLSSTTDFVILYDEMATHWGFVEPRWSRYQPYYSNSACDEEAAFQSSIQNFFPKYENEMVELLRQYKFPVEAVKQVQLDDNGLSDWVIIVNDSPAPYKSSRAWLALAKGTQLVAIRADFYLGDAGRYIAAEQCQLPSSTVPVVILNIGKRRFLFQIKSETAGFHIQEIHTVAGNPADFNSQSDLAEAAKVAHACGLPKGNLWDANQQQFVTLTQTTPLPAKDSTLAEATIFDPDSRQQRDVFIKAAQSLQTFLNDPSQRYLHDDEKARLHYLQGLAYELANNERDAVNVYWQLWHDFPDSPYALIVQRKLERISP